MCQKNVSLVCVIVYREYPCDHYTAIINVTLMCTGCPRAPVHESALQLLQLLDKRFFGTVDPLPADDDSGKPISISLEGQAQHFLTKLCSDRTYKVIIYFILFCFQ